MKKKSTVSITIILCGILLSSCGLEKRKYMNGFYNSTSSNKKVRTISQADEKFLEDKQIDYNLIDETAVASIKIEPLAHIKEKKYVSGYFNKKKEKCDLMIKMNGDEVLGKVTEITLTEIKYKKCNNLDGPTISIRKNDVLLIKYANGTREIISKIDSSEKNDDDYIDRNAKKQTPVKKKTHGLAVTSYIVALSGLAVAWFIAGAVGIATGIVSLIFGIIALSKIKKQPEKYKGKGFAVLGIIIGALSLILSVLFVAILL